MSFSKAIEIYQIRWTIEVFFIEAKQHPYLGKSQSNNFNAQIADTTICMMQYILLALMKRFESFETIGGVFRDGKAALIELTLVERILQLFLQIVKELADLMEIDYETILQKLLHKDSSAKMLAIVNALQDYEFKDSIKLSA